MPRGADLPSLRFEGFSWFLATFDFFLKELQNISKNAQNQTHLYWKTKKLWAFENLGKYGFFHNFLNLLSEILDFSTFKIHNNWTDYPNHLKPFLSDRGDQSIKSQTLFGPKCSPNLNKIAKTEKEGKFANLLLLCSMTYDTYS